jgi:hypothetical protein
MNPDGIAYLDMGDAYLRGDWTTAVRTHWSPLYAWLLGLALRIVQPSPAFEFPLVHLMNVLIFGLALGAFALLLRELRACVPSVPEWALLSFGYAMFVWCSLQYTPLWLVTPDLLVSALVYALCMVLLRASRLATLPLSMGLGLLLGLAYLAKAPMLPLALVFLAVYALQTRSRVHAGAAVLGLALVALPYILLLSITHGRITAGDSAWLNYLWWIDGAPFVHWQGEGPVDIGQPIHRSVLLLDRPQVFAFDGPFPVTYAAWYAPEYWFQGARPVVLPHAHLRALGAGLEVYGRLLIDFWAPLVALGIAFAMAWRGSRLFSGVWLALSAPAVAAFLLFLPVLVEARYVAPFIVLGMLGGLTLLPSWGRTPGAAAALVGAAATILLGQTVGATFDSTRDAVTDLRRGNLLESDEHARVAVALHEAGLEPGDRVASGNRGFNAYWARLARQHIVAEVAGYDGTAILETDADARDAALRALLSQPVRAIVAYGWPPLTGDARWEPIEGTDYFFLLIRPQGQ